MINRSEITQLNNILQIAGIAPADANIEFAGVRKNKTVIWLQHGNSHYFSDLPIQYYNLLKRAYLKDYRAVRFLSEVTNKQSRQVELYTYYMYGELDGTPDIQYGKLSPSENFRDQPNCPSLLWNSKTINIGNHIFTPQQLVIVDLMARDLPDKAVACSIGISPKTLDNHKQTLFKALGISSKYALLRLCYQHKIIG